MNLNGAELMTTGDPDGRGIRFTSDDLQSIVTAFDALGLKGRVPLKFGHDSEKPMPDGQPALGWVSKLWTDGKSLFGDFTDMPQMVFDAISKGLYKFVSVELLRNVQAGTRMIPWVLDAVALLGADQPAFGNLKDLQSLVMRRANLPRRTVVAFQREKFSNIEDTQMTEQEIQALIDKATKPLTEKFTADLAKVKSDSDAAVAAAQAALQAEKVKNKRQSLTDFFNRKVEAGELVRASVDMFETMTGMKDDARVMTIEMSTAETFAAANKVAPKKDPKKLGKDEGGAEDEEGKTVREVHVMRRNAKVKAAGGKMNDPQALIQASNEVLAEDSVLAAHVRYAQLSHIKRGEVYEFNPAELNYGRTQQTG